MKLDLFSSGILILTTQKILKEDSPIMTTASNTQLTTLTPNSNCSASGSGDVNNSTTVQFMAPPNGIAWYTTLVSNAIKSTTLANDIGNAVVTFKAGLTVTYAPSGGGGAYNVLLSGDIVDNGAKYTFAGAVIYMSTAAEQQPPKVHHAR